MLIFSLIFLSSLSWSQDLVVAVGKIQQTIASDVVRQAAEPIPGTVFKTLIPQNLKDADCEIPEGDSPKKNVEVLLITETKDTVQVIAVDHSKPNLQTDNIIQFRQAAVDNVIHYANDGVEFSYSSGMETYKSNVDVVNGSKEIVKVNWIKRADLSLNLDDKLKLIGNVIIQEGTDKAPGGTVPIIDDLMFKTSQRNLNLGTEYKLSESLTLKSGFGVEETANRSASSINGGVSVLLPRGGQLMVFTATKTDLMLDGTFQGQDVGLSYLSPKGVEFKAGLRDLGTNYTSGQAGIKIPLENTPHK